MKKPERESNVDYMYNLHKYIDYIEHQNKELVEDNEILRARLEQILQLNVELIEEFDKIK